MAKRQKTVDDLISQVRSQLDEENNETIGDEEDILPALNRAQDYAANIMARHYEDPLLAKEVLELQGGVQEYDIPEMAFEDRIEKIEITVSGSQTEVQRASYRDISHYEAQNSVDVPYYYAIVGRKIRFVPRPAGSYDARIWYLRAPEELTSPQGRITRINTTDSANQYIYVDSIGDSVSTVADELESYVNLVDGQTGILKGTMQVKRLEGNQVTFKSIPDPSRPEVLNRTVDSDITDLGSGLTVELDDYICQVQGTCVPQIARPMSNFVIQYAVAELMRKLGGPADMELRVLAQFEEQMERMWVGREQTLRVKKRSKNWSLPYRRWYYTRSGGGS